ncbi:hypothetical protein ANCCAN_25011 [Ancylostoma caninum]|uniref:Mesencephalic astrocyte-derived neurotrophic factor homolog n=1 Tax=Ancylostoma caninum TaxID=29170 RepID=A0A368FEB5_ANCCA|nr:hypothetical protein ANCCAN_25011 [Ancylostoma caninum]
MSGHSLMVFDQNQTAAKIFLDKPLDWKNIDLKKMRVKELKNILNEWGEVCKGCTEKSEFVKKIEELKPKYVKEEL